MIKITDNAPYYTMNFYEKFNIYFVLEKNGCIAESDDSDIRLAFDIETDAITELYTGRRITQAVIENILGKNKWSIKDIKPFTEQFIVKFGNAVKKSQLEAYARLVEKAKSNDMRIYAEYKAEVVPARIWRYDICEYIKSYKDKDISQPDSETYCSYWAKAARIIDPTFIISRIFGIETPYDGVQYCAISIE